jgi:hypothetical protein
MSTFRGHLKQCYPVACFYVALRMDAIMAIIVTQEFALQYILRTSSTILVVSLPYSYLNTKQNKQTSWSESASELYRPSDRCLSAKWLPRGQRDGSLRPYSRFYRQKPLLFYQVAPQLCSRGWVDPVPDPLLFFSSAGNRTRASGSVAKNSDH